MGDMKWWMADTADVRVALAGDLAGQDEYKRELIKKAIGGHDRVRLIKEAIGGYDRVCLIKVIP